MLYGLVEITLHCSQFNHIMQVAGRPTGGVAEELTQETGLSGCPLVLLNLHPVSPVRNLIALPALLTWGALQDCSPEGLLQARSGPKGLGLAGRLLLP